MPTGVAARWVTLRLTPTAHLAGFQPGVHQAAGRIFHETDHDGRGQDIHTAAAATQMAGGMLGLDHHGGFGGEAGFKVGHVAPFIGRGKQRPYIIRN